MAFKRHAALLTGTALAGSLLFAQPALAEETFSYAPLSVEKGQSAETTPVSVPEHCDMFAFPVRDSRADERASELVVEALQAEVDAAGTITVEPTAEASEDSILKVSCTNEVGEQNIVFADLEVTIVEIDLTFADVTVTEGEAVDIEATTAPTDFADLKFNAEGIDVEEKDGIITVDASEAEAGSYTVEYSYTAYGEEKDGSFTVTVEEKDENKKDEPKGSANFLGSFKGFGSSK